MIARIFSTIRRFCTETMIRQYEFRILPLGMVGYVVELIFLGYERGKLALSKYQIMLEKVGTCRKTKAQQSRADYLQKMIC
jgi:hypothetical protein